MSDQLPRHRTDRRAGAVALGVAARGRGRRVRGRADRPRGALASPPGRAAGRAGAAPARAGVGRTRERPGRGGHARSRGPRRSAPLRAAARRRAGRRCRRRRAGASGSIGWRRSRRARCGTPRACCELLADLRPMAAVGPVTLAEVRRVLLPRLAQLDRDPPKSRFGRVFVATPDALRGRTFRVVFVVGLAERVFPQRSREDPLLLDDMRKALAAPLAVEDDRVAGERVRLRLAVGAATERCWLSYPRLDVGQGRARVPSFYALDVVRASTGAVPDHVRFEHDTAMATGAWLAWPAPDDPGSRSTSGSTTWRCSAGCCGRPPSCQPKARPTICCELNPALARSLRTRWARWKTTWSPWDGLIGNHAERAGAAGRAAPHGAAVLGVGAAALRRLSVPVPARRDLPLPAARAARGDRPARSADARRDLPRDPARRAAGAARPTACCRFAPDRRGEAQRHPATTSPRGVRSPPRSAGAGDRARLGRRDHADARRPAAVARRRRRRRARSGCRATSSSASACRSTTRTTRRACPSRS